MWSSVVIKIRLFQPSVTFHIKFATSHSSSNQMTGFYMKCNIKLNWVKNSNLKNQLALSLD